MVKCRATHPLIFLPTDMMLVRIGFIFLAALWSWLHATELALGQSMPPGSVDFASQIQPILARHCVACHGPDEQQSALRLDSMRGALRGGDSGEQVVVPGASGRSHLIERVTTDSPALRMPPEGAQPLSPDEIQLLKRWIEDAASWQPIAAELANRPIDHWSFRPVRTPTPPESHLGQHEVQHPIDAFVVARLAREGLAAAPIASRRTLIRRLYLVMLGLPPSPDDVAQFENDQRPDAWQRLVDRVLASPHYGQRWAMHWLDLIRFGETNGFETNRERPFAYRFRDWVITSLNDDKPYDQFVREQIAVISSASPSPPAFSSPVPTISSKVKTSCWDSCSARTNCPTSSTRLAPLSSD